MNREQFEALSELVRAQEVRAVLGITSQRQWDKVRKANPQITWHVPGLTRVRYLRVQVLLLLPDRRA